MEPLQQSAKMIQEKIVELGYTNKVQELPDSTRTAQEAADSIGCDVAQIAKSIIFRMEHSGNPLLVIASGVNRINEPTVEKHIGDVLGKANADFVKEQTGYVIGGVPPFGHPNPITTLIDQDLFLYKAIWAAAGHPKAIVQLTPDELVNMTNGNVIDVTNSI